MADYPRITGTIRPTPRNRVSGFLADLLEMGDNGYDEPPTTGTALKDLATSNGAYNATMNAARPYSAITNFKKYENLTSDNKNLKVDYRPLNFDELLKAGAFRVTHQGLDDGYNPDPMAGFSLVSGYNDAVGEGTRKWKDNPLAFPVVRELMTQRPYDIGAHKYMQIIESARDMGLKDSQIFVKP